MDKNTNILVDSPIPNRKKMQDTLRTYIMVRSLSFHPHVCEVFPLVILPDGNFYFDAHWSNGTIDRITVQPNGNIFDLRILVFNTPINN